LKDVNQTGAAMSRLVTTYYKDLGKLLKLPFGAFFAFVKALPYVADPKNEETVSRPCYSIRPSHSPRDCDDKAVLIGSYLFAAGIPFQFVAVAKNPGPLHHTFAIAIMPSGRRVHCDATYKENTLGENKGYARMIPISRILRRG